MKFSDRLYWFCINFCSFIFFLILITPYVIWGVIYSFFQAIRITFFVTDGSERLMFPWEWELWEKEK